MQTNLLKILKMALQDNNLPGVVAHDEMRPKLVEGHNSDFNHNLDLYQKASVLIALYPEQNELVFPLIERSNDGTVHSGQIAFPGGRQDANENPVECALRESQEELGIDPNAVQVLGKLSITPIPPSQYLVTPVIGLLDSIPKFCPCPVEVNNYFSIPLSKLLDSSIIKSVDKPHRGGIYTIPYFELDNKMVWGATAMMLNELKQILLKN